MTHIHVVVYDLSDPDSSILARKALALRAAGWTVGETPDVKADLNYFFPYITWSQRYNGWHETPTSAYFTHRETANWPGKQLWWDQAAEGVDLRLTTSRYNLPHLEPYGPTALVPYPPIDRDLFKPGRKRKAGGKGKRLPVIGLSGFVDQRSGRKGEAMVQRLARDLRGRAEFCAIGRGWPVPTRLVQQGEIPGFYTSLDAFLCTSTNEGVPMTILEALASGVPVIVPSGVGIVDDLPDLDGIWRYEAGHYPQLLDVARQAVRAYADGDLPDRKALRDATELYTVASWCRDHVAAVDDFLCPAVEPPVRVKDWREAAGMYCVAFGKPSRRCAVTCIRSFKAHHPDIPVAFAGASPLNAGEDVFIQREDIDIGGRLAKLAVYDAAPAEWEYVLYLDADTETVGDLSPLYQTLAHGWEAVICRDMAKYHVARMMRRPDNEAEYNETMDLLGCGEVMQYNGGVFAFRRCEQTREFFELWNREWQKYGARDQGALLRALYQHPLRLWVLGNEWNASDRYPAPTGEVAIWHHNMQARRWGGLIYGRTDDDAAWARVAQWEKQNL